MFSKKEKQKRNTPDMKQSFVHRIFPVIPFLFFFVTLPFGQLGSIDLGNGIFLYIHDIAVGLLLLFTISQKSFRSSLRDYGKAVLPLFLFLCFAGISILLHFSQVPYAEIFRGLLYLSRYIAYSFLFFSVLVSPESSQSWLIGLYSSGSVFAVFGLFQYIFFPALRPLLGGGWDEHFGRLFSTFFDPNFAGMFLVLTFLLGCFFGMKEKKNTISVERTPLWILQILILGAIVLTFSRSAYLAFGLGITILAFRFHLWKWLGVGLFLATFLYIALPKGTLDVNDLTRTTSSLARLESMKAGIQRIVEAPLVGHGFYLLRPLASQDRPLDVNGIVSRDASGMNNSILFVFATTGLIGGILYLWWMLRMFSLFSQTPRLLLGSIGSASLGATVLFSIFNHGLFYAWIVIWLTLLLGIALKRE